MAVPGKVIVHPDAQEFSFSASSKRLPFKKRSKVGWFTCCSFCRVAMRSGFVFSALGTIWFDVNNRLAHPRRPRGSQSGGRALGYRLSPDHFQTVKRMLAPDWAQKCFVYYCAQSANSFSWVLVVSSYTCPACHLHFQTCQAASME